VPISLTARLGHFPLVQDHHPLDSNSRVFLQKSSRYGELRDGKSLVGVYRAAAHVSGRG
jgi:hypothetical protein